MMFEGRIGDVQLALSYLKNEAKKEGGLVAKSSELLNFFVDFNGIFGSSSSLRLKAEEGNVNGVATFYDKGEGIQTVTADGTESEFEAKLTRFSALLMKERGMFYGLEYTDFTTPSTVGFSDSSKSIVVMGLDKAFKIDTYELVFGYDEIAYAKRYETNLNRFFFQAMGGVGAAVYKLSSDIKSQIKAKTPGKKIKDDTFSLAADLDLNVGYIYQKRFKLLRGFGFSFLAGYKARGTYTGSGQSDDSDSKIKENELQLEMSRYDVWHGPYANLNIVF